jgi:hypothetical protein
MAHEQYEIFLETGRLYSKKGFLDLVNVVGEKKIDRKG